MSNVNQGAVLPKFKVGDPVTFVNGYGVKFPERVITEVDAFDKDRGEFRYFFAPHDAHWHSVRESLLVHAADDPVIESAGGHDIRHQEMDTTRGLETWFLVGVTGNSFRELSGAVRFANENPIIDSKPRLRMHGG